MEPNHYPEEFELQKYWSVLKRRWLPALAVFSVVVSLSALAAARQKPVYEAEGKLLLKVDRQADLLGLIENQNRNLTVDDQSSALTTEAEVIRSIPVAQKVVDALQLENEEGDPLEPTELLSNLAVRPVGGTDVLLISYTAGDPEISAAVVNQVAKAYVQQSVFANRQETAEASQFIKEQLPRTEEAVRQAETALRDFKEQNGVVALVEEAQASVNLIFNMQDRLTQAQAQLADASARASMLQSQIGMSPQEALAVSSLSQASGVTEVLAQLQVAESQLAVERTRYRESHPAIASSERRVAALSEALNGRVGQIVGSSEGVTLGDLQVGDVERGLITEFVRAEAERSGLANQVSLLSGAESAYRSRASSLPRLEQTQRELERRLGAAQATYETLLNRLQEIQVTENQNIGNTRLISPALVPTNPVGPSKTVFLLLGGLAGLAAGVISALLLDMTDNSIRSVRQARDLFGYTLLGVIPTFSRNGRVRSGVSMERSVPRVILRDCKGSPVVDAYQMLQANLKFLNSDHPVKTLVVTSSASREGKSEVSANLAASLASVGHKVLLVDADLRHPVQHITWDVTNAAGLSNVLIDQVDYQDAVQRVMDNLDVLPAGIIPPNPIGLLDSNRMQTLVSEFSEDYDYVIFDTPPVAGIADAAVLGKMADGVMMVVRPGVVDPASANASREYLMQSGQNVLGIVVNGADIRNEPDGLFYYSRDYQASRRIAASNTASVERALSGARQKTK